MQSNFSRFSHVDVRYSQKGNERDDGIAFFLMFYARNYMTDFSAIIAGDY
jgi:hypothetical protein